MGVFTVTFLNVEDSLIVISIIEKGAYAFYLIFLSARIISSSEWMRCL